MISRREFLGAAGAATVAGPLATAAAPAPARKRLAVVTNVWTYHSHAWHMAERFLHGYPLAGKWHHPPIDVVSAYVDQQPAGDLSRGRAKEFKFTIFTNIEDALLNGGTEIGVDAVLVIGEHGKYPKNDLGQTQYPRYEFFKQIVAAFGKYGRSVPVFNDKHLSWKWEWAKEMVDTARRMSFPLLAGSSLPLTWRMPAVDLPLGTEVEEVVGVAYGPLDIYDFHALEMVQCVAERRKGGETGVKAVHVVRGDAVWDAMAAKAWDARLFEACLSRSHTLAQPPTFSHRYPTPEQMRAWVKDPVAYRVEYADGLRATVLMLNGLVQDFTLAARLKGEADPLSTLFYLPPNPNVVYSAALMSKAEEMFLTGKSPYPVERTLLTSGLVAAGLRSLKEGKRLETPHLAAVKYQPPKESQFWTR